MKTHSVIGPVISPIIGGLDLGRPSWSIARLFAHGEQGAWYDPSDLSTLFQDSAGTTPVTAHGQPVGLMLDKSKGLVRGDEVNPNVGFDTNLSGWSAGANTTAVWSGGEALVTVGGPLTSTLNNWFCLDQIVGINKRYTVSFDATHVSGGSLEAGVGFGLGLTVTAAENGGVKRRYTYTASGGAGGSSRPCTFGGAAGAVWRIDNVSVRELPGNHASQPTTAQRPMLRDTPRRIDYDAVDDSLGITFPSSLGSNCTVARSIPGVGAQILTAQTIGTSFTDNVDSCSLIIVNRTLTAAETANLTRYLNQRASV